MKKGWLIAIAVISLAIILLFFVRVRLTGYFGTSIDNCQDTDFGKDYLKKGIIRGEFNDIQKGLQPEYFLEEDYCKNSRVLVEYYCITEGIHSYQQSEEFVCSEGCSEGKCIGDLIETPKKNSFLEFFRNLFS